MKILMGYDGSECADAALDDLTQAGLPSEAEAHILRFVLGSVSAAVAARAHCSVEVVRKSRV